MSKYITGKDRTINNSFITQDNTTQDKTFIKKFIFYEYELLIEVDEFNKFKGIKEIKINKDFLKTEQRQVSQLNIEDLYED